MQTLFKSVSKFFLITGLSLVVFNCSKDDTKEIVEDQTITSTEVKTILETENLSSAADDIITSIFQQGQSGKSARSNDCYVAEYTDTGFTVTFDNCTESGHTISGTINVVYEAGDNITSFVTTYSNLIVGDYTINGTRDFNMDSENSASASFTIVSAITLTHTDGTSIEESGSKTFAVVFDSTNFENSALTIDGNWTITQNDDTYTVIVSSPLEYIFGCTYVGKGIMAINKNGLEVDIDFGDGTCDALATMIYPNGTEEEINLND